MLFHIRLYDDPPRPLQSGDIYRATWLDVEGKPAYGVKFPNNLDWFTLQSASNCIHPLHKGKLHTCWKVEGTPPLITVSPSLGLPGYHCWIRNGEIVPG